MVPPSELLAEVEVQFAHRKFAAGLAIAFIDFLEDIAAIGAGLKDYSSFLERYPRRLKTSAGKTANTLIVGLPSGGTKSIRSYYDRVQEEIRAKHHRLDYPSAAPHATQGWVDYTHWLGAMVAMSHNQLARLRSDILAFVLAKLVSHEIDHSSLPKEPPVFCEILKDFDFGARVGEPTGAAFQGAVFGYLRADAPHLQVEVRKVRTGSKRVGGIGDIDAWDGDRLVLTAEAKHSKFTFDDVAGIAGFLSGVTRNRATGMVVADTFDELAKQALTKADITPLSRQDLVRFVSLWDPLKQRIAARSFLFYASHIEQNGPLSRRVREFMANFAKNSA